jgi:hypothetical protein
MKNETIGLLWWQKKGNRRAVKAEAIENTSWHRITKRQFTRVALAFASERESESPSREKRKAKFAKESCGIASEAFGICMLGRPEQELLR